MTEAPRRVVGHVTSLAPAVYSERVIDVVGVPAAGPSALGAAERELVAGARVVVGSPRLLALLDERPGQERRAWPSPMLPGLRGLFDETGLDGVVVLATGDPLVSGVGTTLIRVLGSDVVRVHPAVSSVALARARMGWPAETVEVVSLVSSTPYAVRRHLAPGARVVALSAGAQTPGRLAAVLAELGLGETRMTVLGDLGTDDESRLDCAATDLAHAAGAEGEPGDPARDTRRRADGIPALNVVALEVPDDAHLPGTSPGLPDDDFTHDGQITKSEARALALASLRPLPGQHLWDLGAGSGSVSVEWCLAAPRTSVSAVERDPQRAARVTENARRFGVPVEVVEGASLDRIGELPPPDAVFVGGGASAELVDACWRALRRGGRIVVHAVTLGTEAVVVDVQQRHGGELRRFGVDRARPLGRHLSWEPARPIVQWAATKPHVAPATTETAAGQRNS
ncbi:precorrin-6Y C5,15-methyltransferase (decarboxylating) [Knoellia remsis]|uniref:Precorrin-6Y C5,15-methyltransferase (Decarboxylating) n=1 Tax=Knoellia remsis TaxID=407159 RepID=A0A2T0UZP8_9MICO|nr:precorrin-6Y C5,15-methyltransferase (decarboxylating) [Knoellia remsis]